MLDKLIRVASLWWRLPFNEELDRVVSNSFYDDEYRVYRRKNVIVLLNYGDCTVNRCSESVQVSSLYGRASLLTLWRMLPC